MKKIFILLIFATVFFFKNSEKKDVKIVKNKKSISTKVIVHKKEINTAKKDTFTSNKNKNKIKKNKSRLPVGKNTLEIRVLCQEMYAQTEDSACYRVYMLCEKDSFKNWRLKLDKVAEKCEGFVGYQEEYDECLDTWASADDQFELEISSCLEENVYMDEEMIAEWESVEKPKGFNFTNM